MPRLRLLKSPSLNGPAWPPAARQTLSLLLSAGAPLDRRQVQVQTGLAWATVTQAFEILEQQGLITPVGHGPSTGGRPPLSYAIDGKRRALVGIDYERSTLTLRVVRLDGATVFEDSEPVSDEVPPDEVAQRMLGLAERLRRRKIMRTVLDASAASDQGPLAIGVGVPKLLRDRTSDTPGLLNVQNALFVTGLLEKLETRLNLPVFLGPNVHALAVAEGWYGAARDCRHYVYLSFRTGVAMAMVVRGRLYQGNHGLAGELGHMTVDPRGPESWYGKRGRLEDYAGGAALISAAQTAGWQPPKTERAEPSEKIGVGDSPDFARLRSQLSHLVADALGGHAAAAGALSSAASYAGQATAEVAHLFDPQRIVVGGVMAQARVITEAPLLEAFHERTLPTHRDAAEVVFSTLGEASSGGALGAAALGLEGILNP